jgi:flagellar FliL protein
MADQTTAAPDTTDGAPTKSRKKLVIIALLVVVLGAAAGVFLLGGSDAEGTEPAAPVEGEVVDVAVMTTSVAGEAGTYVRVGFAAVLVEGTAAADVEAKFPLLEDAALSAASSFSGAQLRTQEGQDGLRAALTTAAGDIWPDGEVLRIVLTELLVQ